MAVIAVTDPTEAPRLDLLRRPFPVLAELDQRDNDHIDNDRDPTFRDAMIRLLQKRAILHDEFPLMGHVPWSIGVDHMAGIGETATL